MTKHICPCCDKPVDLAVGEPSSLLPDAALAVPGRRMKGNSDYFRVDDRFFVRGVVPFAVQGVETPFRWGVWVELGSEDDFHRILDLHNDPEQGSEPAFEVKLANDLLCYEETLNLPCKLQLTGTRTRPAVLFTEDVDHPFAAEQRAGVSPHRIGEWMEHFS